MRKVLAGFSAVVLVFFTHFSVEAASIPRDEFFELFTQLSQPNSKYKPLKIKKLRAQ